jgi:hypothetical protein
MTPYARDHATPSPAAQDDPAKGLEVGNLIALLRTLSALESGWYANVGKRTGEQCCAAMTEAADALDTATRQIAELRAQRDWANDGWAIDKADLKAANAARLDAEADAAMVREAATLLDECIWLDGDTKDYRVEHDGSVEKARAILATLTQRRA